MSSNPRKRLRTDEPTPDLNLAASESSHSPQLPVASTSAQPESLVEPAIQAPPLSVPQVHPGPAPHPGPQPLLGRFEPSCQPALEKDLRKRLRLDQPTTDVSSTSFQSPSSTQSQSGQPKLMDRSDVSQESICREVIVEPLPYAGPQQYYSEHHKPATVANMSPSQTKQLRANQPIHNENFAAFESPPLPLIPQASVTQEIVQLEPCPRVQQHPGLQQHTGPQSHPGPQRHPVPGLNPEHPEIQLEPNLPAFIQSDILNIFSPEAADDGELFEEDSGATGESADGGSAQCNHPLYPGAPISLHQSFVAILTLVLTFKLSGVCIKSILDLIAFHLPKNNIFRTSLQAFKDYFLYMQGPKTFEYYCSKCFKSLQPNTKCNICPDGKVCFLVKLSIVQQLETLMQRKGFYSKLRFSSDTSSEDISDVYSGQQYANMVSIGCLGKEGQLSGKWYTDGASLYKSSNVSAWPQYISINELPLSERFKPKNVLVTAIWVGPVKPPCNLLFSAAYPELSKLSSGIKFAVNGHGEKNISLCLLDGTGDTPARSLAMNLVQFNGEYSCQCCLQKGEARHNCPGVRIFPYAKEEMVARTLQGMKEHAKDATPDNPVMGVKGPSVLSKLTPDFVSGTCVDAMHLVYHGVGKKVLKLLTSSEKKDKGKWSIHQHADTINNLLLNIKPPCHCDRTPRSLSDLGYWKIKESKAWFEDYSLAILHGLLPSRYLVHHATIVAAIQLLNADVVTTKKSIPTAKKLLHAYVAQFADFYDVKYLTINFHLLLHLWAVVLANGPLWCYSCFPLESINGLILCLVHGTRWAERQIATSLQTCLGLPDLVDTLPESPCKDFCKNLIKRQKFVRSQEVERMIVIDTPVPLQTTEMSDLLRGLKYTRISQFSYLKKGKYTFASASSQLSKKRDSSAAVYQCENGAEDVGIIQTFLQLHECTCETKCECPCELYVVLEKVQVTYRFPTLVPDVVVPNNFQYIGSNCNIVLNARALKSVCVKIPAGNKMYMSKPANTHEYE
ncbi:uncharacterized protein LOC117643340 [Thrips palmi]|uniref:Uncharacterized protein LOC117643340 n=1 Tax=Thrips palmi TaxID=161013 RepID=A0A6P8YML6_THRPL|nr:uncharacterized protein LOC117643340 [Thrips palmi]